jgi:RHS repeat-associated protein
MLPSLTYGRIAQRVFFNAKGETVRSDHSTNNAFDRSYEFDGIGNRKKSADSLTLPATDNYTSNALNQYSAVGVVARVHDADGNITDNGEHLYEWDGENRLIEVKKKSDNSTVATYAYDYQSRRITKTVGSAVTNFVYNGWNPIAEFTGTTLSKSYTWGMDLSGSMQGAGGVGGLLSVNDGLETYFSTFDGNGNVSEYVDATGTPEAHYEYDAFGQAVASGTKANDFSHQFSTKQRDAETGLNYYGYRFYSAETGRWLGRDPIEEEGGLNLYGFVENNGVNQWDYLGLLAADWKYTPETAPYEEKPNNIFVKKKTKTHTRGRVSIDFYVRGYVDEDTPCKAKVVNSTDHTSDGVFLLLDFWILQGEADSTSGIKYPYAPDMPDMPAGQTMTVETHERYHLTLYMDEYKKLQNIVNPLEKTYSTSKCASTAAELITQYKIKYLAQGRIRNSNFDYNAYGGGRDNTKDYSWLQAAEREIGELQNYLMTKCSDDYDIPYE